MADAKQDSALNEDLAVRLHKALTGTSEELYQTVQDTSNDVLRAALKNPGLSEDHLLVLLKRRDLNEEIPKTLYNSKTITLSHRVEVALVNNPATSASVALTLLPRLYLFELVNLLYLPGATPDQKVAAEREIIRRLPQVPLGNQKTLARRGSNTIAAEILKRGHPETVQICLANPHIKEVALLQFLTGGAASAETISMIARHPRWKHRAHLQMTILKNPKTPGIWFTLWLPKLKTQQLKELKSSRRISQGNRILITEELKKRRAQ